MINFFGDLDHLSTDLQALEDHLTSIIQNEKREGDIAIIFTDDSKIRHLNNQYRQIDKPTDVLSFSSPSNELGDIYISLDRALHQANQIGSTLEKEIKFLATHGTLHLIGYDHQTEADEQIMLQKQKQYCPKDIPTL